MRSGRSKNQPPHDPRRQRKRNTCQHELPFDQWGLQCRLKRTLELAVDWLCAPRQLCSCAGLQWCTTSPIPNRERTMKLEVPENKRLLHTVTTPIRWGDMDAMGHVNNTVYFRYMEQARIEWLESFGFGTSVTHLLQFHPPVGVPRPGDHQELRRRSWPVIVRHVPRAAACRQQQHALCQWRRDHGVD